MKNKKTNGYRQLTEAEMATMRSNNCRIENREDIYVTPGFDPLRCSNVFFSGKVYIGDLTGHITLPGDVRKECGIHYAHIHNCSIGNNVFINHITNYIANYDIGDNVIIDNADVCTVDGVSSFGNGTHVRVLDETGGRNVVIYDNLSAHFAYIMAFYKHHTQAIEALESMIESHTRKAASSRGMIGDNSQIFNCRKIVNVKIGPYTVIDGANILENGSLNGNAHAPVKLGYATIMRNFIVASGSEIADGAIVVNCFIGQGCVLGAQYSAQHSLFFANCQGFHGEACSVFAGPYTVTHHKSTLLIAGMFSFCNAGSGSNQSNHMYKLGPIHHGIVERGSKTTSDSYLLWPAKIGAFTLVMGRHYKNSDTSNIPFSYLIENNDESWLVPGANLKSVGTIRDAMKWPRRDKRNDPHILDRINFNLLSPFTIQKMANATEVLTKIKNISGETTEVFSYNNTKIKRTALEHGLNMYRLAIMKFMGNSVITRLNQCRLTSPEKVAWCLTPRDTTGLGDWIDLAGLIAPKTEIARLIDMIEKKTITTLCEIETFFDELHANYYEYEWTWTAEFIKSYTGRPITDFTVDDLLELVEKWKDCVIEIDKVLYEDAKKEYRMEAMTGFGIDGDETVKQLDFEQVRGKFEDNDFVREILNHIEKKTNLGMRVTGQLNEAKGHLLRP